MKKWFSLTLNLTVALSCRKLGYQVVGPDHLHLNNNKFSSWFHRTSTFYLFQREHQVAPLIEIHEFHTKTEWSKDGSLIFHIKKEDLNIIQEIQHDLIGPSFSNSWQVKPKQVHVHKSIKKAQSPCSTKLILLWYLSSNYQATENYLSKLTTISKSITSSEVPNVSK